MIKKLNSEQYIKLIDFHLNTLDFPDESIYFVDNERKILYWNKNAERLTGYLSEEVTGRFCHDNILKHINRDGESLCQTKCPLNCTICDGKQRTSEVFLKTKMGERISVKIKAFPLKDNTDNIVGAIEIFSNNSILDTTNQIVSKLKRLEMLDENIFFPNRKYIDFEIEKLKVLNSEKIFNIGLFGIKMENYEKISEFFSEDISEKLLKVIATTIKANINKDFIIGRISKNILGIIVDITDSNFFNQKIELLKILIKSCEFPILPVSEKQNRINFSFHDNIFNGMPDFNIPEYIEQKMKNCG